jgi:hypothetical protein
MERRVPASGASTLKLYVDGVAVTNALSGEIYPTKAETPPNGAAVDYWLAAFGGVEGDWLIVDHDHVDVSNLNRQIIFRAQDAGYPSPPAKPKAEIVASILDVAANTKLWGKDPEIVGTEYDLVLALANEEAVRPALQDRHQPVLLHATTPSPIRDLFQPIRVSRGEHQ